MRPVNLKSVIIAAKGLPTDQRDELYKVWGIEPKPNELSTLEAFLQECDASIPNQPEQIARIVGECFFGFIIPRISKEFDCLWIGENTIVNLELKSDNVGRSAIEKQLKQNRYYLNPLKKSILSYTYDLSTGSCYSMDTNNNLVNVVAKDIVMAIAKVHNEALFEGSIESLFPPEQYLVSPFNATEEFLKGNYFLTNQQEGFKNQILQFAAEPSKGEFCAISGGPGSGKTLLLYDIVKTLKDAGKTVIIGHSGGLNGGHYTLIKQGWNIIPTKNIWTIDINTGGAKLLDADIYMIDEAQRCSNFDTVVNEMIKTGKRCIFSFDADQVMSDDEEKRDNASKILSKVGGNLYKLTSNIRTNADVYDFIKALFYKRSQVGKDIRAHVEISYCQNISEAIAILNALGKKGYTVPKFTPKHHGNREEYEFWFPCDSLSAHEVIGQEFDSIAGLLNEKMYYNANGKLVTRSRYFYREDKMLYQILSRARHKVHLVIVNNPEVLERCLKLLGKWA